MKKTTFVLAALAAFGVAESAQAQRLPLSVEVRVDGASGQGDFGDAVEGGVGFGVNAALGITPGLGVYGGYSTTGFELETVDGDATDAGFAVGLTAALPSLGSGRVSPYIGAGLLLHELTLDANLGEGSELEVEVDSDPGFEVGGGLAISLTPTVRVTPGIGYRRYDTESTLPGFDRVEYLTYGVGLNLSF